MNHLARLAATVGVLLVAVALILMQQPPANADKPVARWQLDSDSVVETRVPDTVGKQHATITGTPTFAPEGVGIETRGLEKGVLVGDRKAGDPLLPKEAFTLSACVRIDEGTRWGGIAGCVQDNGDKEKGFLLGYGDKTFTFALATAGADDGDGKITYLAGKTAFEPRKWYFVSAVYDGKWMRLFVNGKLDAESDEQSGSVLHADRAPFVLGAYRDDDEHHSMHGAIREVTLDHAALDEKTLAARFEPFAGLAARPAKPAALQFVIPPYLQFVTQTSIIVMWETSEAGIGSVQYGPDGKLTENVTEKEGVTVHEVRLDGLAPATNHAYQVTTTLADGRTLIGPLLTFRTAVGSEDAFSFVLIGDTQRNPVMTGKVAKAAWNRRPNFVVHLGDVVDDGPSKQQWVEDLFKPCQELFGRTAVFPCIGNHEKNHAHYYRYFSLPDPEYYYRYSLGNADFFVLDTNKPIKADSEQYRWLDGELSRSKATWKICYHHHPARSSDEDDYGDTRKGKPSKEGNASSQALVPLYEKHGVDLVFNGHVHAYERTWPVREGKVDRERGVTYVTSGGGGGKLEVFSPTPTWFKAMTRTDFHYTFVAVHGKRLSLKAFDHEDRLFDLLDIAK